jgi:putative hemolysin
MKRILSLSGILFLLASCVTPATQPAETPQAHLPNPASVFCEEQGYKLEIRTAEDGSQTGVCIFPDGSECDEWAFFRNECGPGSEATEPPASATSIYTPALVTPNTSLYEGWIEYKDSHYGFKFRYPPEWTAELDLRNDSTSYQHLLWLRAPAKPVAGVQMNIAFEHIDENHGLQRTGIGSGELVERGNVLFLGEPARRIALSLDGRDMEIIYGDTGAFQRGIMRFAISLNYVGGEPIGLITELEQVADLIVASFEMEN